MIAVEESKDAELLDVDGLVGSLITYESRRFSHKAKIIAPKTTKNETKVVFKESCDDESSNFEPIAMLTRNFQKYPKKVKQTRRKSSKWSVKGESQKDPRDKSYRD